jgi:hypothetical protein
MGIEMKKAQLPVFAELSLADSSNYTINLSIMGEIK